MVRQRLQPGQFPADMRRLGMGVHAPLELSAQQRMQPAQVDLAGAEHRISRRAPPPERCLAAVTDRDRLAAPLVAVGPLRRQSRGSGPALSAVPALVAGAQFQRRVRQLGTYPHPAGAVTRMRFLRGQPGGTTRAGAVPFTVPEPAERMLVTQHEGDVASGPLRADPAPPLTGPGASPRGRAARRKSTFSSPPCSACRHWSK